MGLLDRAKNDIKDITSNSNDFAVTLIFQSPTNQIVEVKGLGFDHSNMYDEEGQPITGKYTHVNVAEELLTAQNYPTRNDKQLIDLQGHKVTINYADGSVKKYIIDDVRPDYTINLLTLVLSDYNGLN